jgi:hypothetical protein
VDGQPVQMRIAYGQPTSPATIDLALAGMIVLVTAGNDREDLAVAYLTAVGVTVAIDDTRGITFPALQLGKLRDLPERVTVRADEQLRPVAELLRSERPDGVPAALRLDDHGRFELSWFDGIQHHDETLDPSAAPLLLHAEIPLVSTPDAWQALTAASHIPPSTGTARVNMDGFVEVTTTRPQLVEAAPVRAMFRVDERTFGVPMPYVADLDRIHGFTWDGPRPTVERASSTLPALQIPLSRHHRTDLRQLIDDLTSWRAQIIWWDSGLGRRVLALAALEALEAWPALVVAGPANVWAWTRHCDLIGRSFAMTHQDADVHLITYRDLAGRRDLRAPGAIILDDVFSDEVSAAPVRAGLRRLAALDAVRVAVTSDWPDDRTEVLDVMSLLRPGEFRSGVPIGRRYPGDATQAFDQHVDAYLSRRSGRDDNDPTRFRRSTVVKVEASVAQVAAQSGVYSSAGTQDPRAQLARLLEIASAGPPSALSPKVAATIDRARRAVDAGRRVAIATRHRRVATMLTASLRSMSGVTVTQTDAAAGAPDSDVVVVRFDDVLPDLRSYDVVVLVDYPWSMDEIDNAVGAASDSSGVDVVLVVHAAGTVDDRLALLAARRRELGSAAAHTRGLSDAEVSYLLQPRV